MSKVIIEGIHKWELVDMGGWYNVSLSELMGDRWVKLGPAEPWCVEDVKEAFEEVQ